MSERVEEYMALVDGLVATRDSAAARRVMDGVWHGHRASDGLRFKDLLATLQPAQRDSLAEIVQGTADAAICDVLVFLADQGYRLSRGGVELALKPFGNEMHQDFLRRRDGAHWPASRAEAAPTPSQDGPNV